MPLTALQMSRMSTLLDEALPLDPAGRRAWLFTLPPEDVDLVLALREALLPEDFETTGASRLLTLFTDGKDDPSGEMSGLTPGARVGPYELIRLLGAGGMAEVWLAQRADGAFKRRVALKVPAAALMRNDLGQRFARERDILASLEHPHIARLYDAGIDPAGWPYLSMEYVQGEPLTDWCDTHRLDVRSRVRLFLQVLTAVQYAHERHVIHRDLKPSNILVTEAGQVRLLDFGVAKLLAQGEETGAAPLTRVYGQALTPVYASPELVSGSSVDARSDIYSLGILLFEMLTGDRPYRLNAGASRGMLEQAIATVDVHKPSSRIAKEGAARRAATQEQLSRQLRGDLDLIVLKALEKDPAARYASAADLADDLQRYLDGRPVKAQPPRLRYRLRKYLRRNRTVVAVIAAAGIAVLAMSANDALERRTANQSQRTATMEHTAALRRPISDMSIAVLPFLDLSENKDQGYFADGLSEELIDLLAQIQSLQVIARTSSFYFKGKTVAIPEIASVLGVAHVLEGSVRRSGRTVRVTAQLIRADSGVHLWSQTYDRDEKDIFQVQDDIAAAVVGALKLKLLPTQVVDPYRSDNAEAYNQFLLAREFRRRGDLPNIERAAAAYRKAAELDPRYAVAYVGLSFTESTLANAAPDPAGFERASSAAEKALELAPQLADAYRARALVRLELLNFAGARADGERALALAPGDSRVQSLYGVGLAAFGRIREAIVTMNKAIDLDPLNSFAWANLGLFLCVDRDYPAAHRALDRALAIDPDDYPSHIALAELDLLEGRLQPALTGFQKQGNEAASRMGTAMVEHSSGHEREAQQALKELIAKHARDNAYQIGDVYAWLGDRDKAFEWLERAYQQRDSGLNGVAYDALLVSLHPDPRYAALLSKLQLPQ